MDATPQLVLSAALTMRTRRPLVAFGLGLASHLALDAIPHYHLGWIMGFSPAAAIDLALGTSLAALVVIAAPAPWGSLVGAVGGVSPEIARVALNRGHDALEGLPFDLPHGTIGLPWGALTECAVTVLGLLLAFRLRRTPPKHGLVSGIRG